MSHVLVMSQAHPSTDNSIPRREAAGIRSENTVIDITPMVYEAATAIEVSRKEG
jgi:hypothetical protein